MMTRAISNCGLRVFLLSVALLVLVQAASAQGQQGSTGDLSVVGEVTVNGTVASTGDIVLSGSTVQAHGNNSSAVVSLGKLGRVELLPNSRIELVYDVDGRRFSIMLDAGSVRVQTGNRVTSSITRR